MLQTNLSCYWAATGSTVIVNLPLPGPGNCNVLVSPSCENFIDDGAMPEMSTDVDVCTVPTLGQVAVVTCVPLP